jgi:YhcH/YjgK/YiaL family protein
MILDRLRNAYLYYSIHENIAAGLKFLESISMDINLGTYEINSKVKAIVSEYDTKTVNPDQFEAHKLNIDIQFPIRGLEGIEWSPLDGMNQMTEYDESKDITFYRGPSQKPKVILGNGVFAIFFQNDAHNPALAVNDISQKIKKVTLKVLAE